MVDFLHYAAFDSDLPIILQVGDIEGKWFDPYRHIVALEESGYWSRFLIRMINFTENVGESCTIRWKSFMSDMVWSPAMSDLRRSRCLEIIINDERIIITLNFSFKDFAYNDVVFTVRCSNEKIIPLAVLFGDEILG